MATITSIAGGAPKPVFDRLKPLYERQTGNTLNALYDSIGHCRACRRARGSTLLMPVATIENYIKQARCRAPVRRWPISACGRRHRRAAPRCLHAGGPARRGAGPRGVGHAPPTARPSGAQRDKVIETLGIGEALARRVAHRVGLAGGLAMIASGEATLGIFPKSEIVSVPGITLAGPLPPSLQLTISYGAGVTAASPVAAQAAEFVRFLIEPDSRKVWTACGFDPL